jgi:hypothetical protein
MTSNSERVSVKWFELIPEALLHVANKILVLKEEKEEEQQQKDDYYNYQGIRQVNSIIAKDLQENAARLEDIATEFMKQYDQVRKRAHNSLEDLIKLIDANERIVRFTLNVYAADLIESRNKIIERLKEIQDNNDSNDEDKTFFFNQFCKTENLDRLLDVIDEFIRHDIGRKLRVPRK